ncbi:hypothetical protein FO519_002311 [Halicephalobus sp. NKZ332]|nr:hypothetical protein FO519_002311 [Halicephalobus sp. NKZ332]
MAVTTRSASKTEIQSSKATNDGFFGIFLKFTFLIFFFTSVIGSTLLYHNCGVSEERWIPKSQGFCNDVTWSLQNLRIRNTLFDNAKLTLDSFNFVVFQQFSLIMRKMGEEMGEKSTELFNKSKELAFNAVRLIF